MSVNSKNLDFSYYICFMIEGSGSVTIPLRNGSGRGGGTQNTCKMQRGKIEVKVPKPEIFVTELFILSDPIWVGDLRNEPKKPVV